MIYGKDAVAAHDVVLTRPSSTGGRRTASSRRRVANTTVTVSAGGDTEYLRQTCDAIDVQVLGVAPALGRSFTEGDLTQSVVILSDGFWKRHFGSSPHVVGQTLRIMDAGFTVVGVMPPGFHIDPPDGEQLYLPLPLDPNRKHGFLRIIARLKSGVSPAQARSDLDAIAQRLELLHGRANGQRSPSSPWWTHWPVPTTRCSLARGGVGGAADRVHQRGQPAAGGGAARQREMVFAHWALDEDGWCASC
jgi:hypothetical protein